jgi:hypothetical protein
MLYRDGFAGEAIKFYFNKDFEFLRRNEEI